MECQQPEQSSHARFPFIRYHSWLLELKTSLLPWEGLHSVFGVFTFSQQGLLSKPWKSRQQGHTHTTQWKIDTPVISQTHIMVQSQVEAPECNQPHDPGVCVARILDPRSTQLFPERKFHSQTSYVWQETQPCGWLVHVLLSEFFILEIGSLRKGAAKHVHTTHNTPPPLML